MNEDLLKLSEVKLHLVRFDLIEKCSWKSSRKTKISKLQAARKANVNDRARDRCHEPICSFVFMHGSSDHYTDCMDRHMILDTDILTENTKQIPNGVLRFHVLQIITPTEYIVRPTQFKSDGEKWNDVNGSDAFMRSDLKMQSFYKNAANVKCLTGLKLGEKCVVERHEKFYRGDIIRVSSKR